MATAPLGIGALLGALLLPSLALAQSGYASPPVDVGSSADTAAPDAAPPNSAAPNNAAPSAAAPDTVAGDTAAADAIPQPVPPGANATPDATSSGTPSTSSPADPATRSAEDPSSARTEPDTVEDRARREELRQQIDALQSDVGALTEELAAAREQSARMEQEVLRLRAERAAEEQRARENSAAVAQSSQQVEATQRQLATGSGDVTELQRAQAVLAQTDPASPRGVHAREASRLIGAAIEAMQRDSLYEARVLLQQASEQARSARASPYGAR